VLRLLFRAFGLDLAGYLYGALRLLGVVGLAGHRPDITTVARDRAYLFIGACLGSACGRFVASAAVTVAWLIFLAVMLIVTS
jgi:hypothetical protein